MVSIQVDLSDALRGLDHFAQKQMPFATALGINDTLSEAKTKSPALLERALDRPTPYTKRGVFVQRASKARLYGVVGFKDRQAAYLRLQVEGGSRKPKGKAILMPVGQRRNKYGNMPKGAVSRLTGRGDVFVAKRGEAKTQHLAAGVYKRPKRGKYRGGAGTRSKAVGRSIGPQLLVSFKDRATYLKSLRWSERVARGIERGLPDHITKRLVRAMASAR